MEHNRDEQDMLRVLGTLVEWLQAAEQRGLRRAFVVWIRRVLLPNRAPGMELPEFNDLQDLHEVHDMLAERIKKWPEQWEERGIQKGIQKGRQEGRMEGIQQGERIGIQKAKRETARNLISMNILTDAQIAQASGLSEAEVQCTAAKIQNPPFRATKLSFFRELSSAKTEGFFVLKPEKMLQNLYANLH